MKKLLLPIILGIVTFTLFSCGAKNIPYFKNIDTLDLSRSKGLYDVKIMPKDLLSIVVCTTNPQAAAPFNPTGSSTSSSESTGGGSFTYLVDNDGNINFPVLGMVKVAGLTKRQCEAMICEKIKPYMAETEKPIVDVKMASFKITVLGEVGSPGEYTVTTEKVSILQALADAGDMTIYGKRNNVMLIREDATGQKSVHRLNLNDANLINSPLYYLQQNDAIIVEPVKMKTRNAYFAQSTSLWVSLVSVATSVTSLVFTITRR